MPRLGLPGDCCERNQPLDEYVHTQDGRVRCSHCLEDLADYAALPSQAQAAITDMTDMPIPSGLY